MSRLTEGCCIALCASVMAAAAVTEAAWSQTADPQLQAGSSGSVANGSSSTAAPNLQAVVITGTLLKPGSIAPTPVTAVSAAQIHSVAPNDVSQALEQLPDLIGSTLTSNNGQVSAAAATNGQDLLSLHGLGPQRTLVLLDGNVLPVTNSAGSTDINILPQALIERADIVEGGASATYGADAVAGVTNFILNTGFRGLEVSANGGETTYGDAGNEHFTVAYGTGFADGRGLVIGSADYFHEDGIGLPPTGRSWDDNAWGAYPNPVRGALPAVVVVPNVRSSDGTYGGLITSGPLNGMQFGPGGALEPFDPGTEVGPNFSSGGDGAYVVNGISPTENRQSYFVHAEYELSHRLTLLTEGMYDSSGTASIGAPPFEVGSRFQFTIFNNNAYLPSAVQQMFAQNPTVTSFTMGRYSADLTPIINNDLTRMGRIMVGLKGDLVGRWNFDTHLIFSRTEQDLAQTDTINRNLYAAADAVVDPATGQVVCRSTLEGLDAGCVPVNLFGPNSITPQAAAYIEGWQYGDLSINQTAFNANFRGDLGDTVRLPAGRISAALGAAYQQNQAVRSADPLSYSYTSCAGLRGCPAGLNGVYGAFQSYNPSPLSGRISALEGYGELGVPLLKDLPLIKSLGLDLAGRRTDYDVSGIGYSEYSWKFGANWQINRDVQLHATRSQDFRAPDVGELFTPGTSATSNMVFPSSTAPAPFAVTGESITEANLDLRPERGLTTTVGVKFTPSALPGFLTTLDFYDIGITGAISSVGGESVIDYCAAGESTYCSLISVGGVPISNISQVTPTTADLVVTGKDQNIASLGTSGLDLVISDAHRLFGGNLVSRWTGNYVVSEYNSLDAGTGSPVLLGALSVTYGYPRWASILSERFTHAAHGDSFYSLYVQERFIGSGEGNPNLVTGVGISRNDVPTVTYTDLTATYDFHALGDLQLYFNVTNLFNRDPPVTVIASSSFEDPTTYSLYDVLGRRFELGIRLKL